MKILRAVGALGCWLLLNLALCQGVDTEAVCTPGSKGPGESCTKASDCKSCSCVPDLSADAVRRFQCA